jgi:RNA polymerase sigma-70 factor (ECF subfamily)
MSEFADRLAALRPALLRTARQRVRNEAWAEDAVSETLVAALEQPAAFAGRAQLRTWLVGILKHKLVDQMRRHGREHSADCAAAPDDGAEDALDACADTTPLWGIDVGAGWGDPQERLLRRQFLEQLERSLHTLPARQGQAFVLRECLEEDAEDVCRQLGVSANNLSVMVHRARSRLRDSLLPAFMPCTLASPGVQA